MFPRTKYTVIDAVMVRAEDSLPAEDCWLLTEKYANKLPIAKDIEKCYPAPSWQPTEYPRQSQKKIRNTLKENCQQVHKSLLRGCEITLIIFQSKTAANALKYFALCIFFICTILFTIWVYLTK